MNNFDVVFYIGCVCAFASTLVKLIGKYKTEDADFGVPVIVFIQIASMMAMMVGLIGGANY